MADPTRPLTNKHLSLFLLTQDRKALLLYHPDKTGRGDRDAVFIAGTYVLID